MGSCGSAAKGRPGGGQPRNISTPARVQWQQVPMAHGVAEVLGPQALELIQSRAKLGCAVSCPSLHRGLKGTSSHHSDQVRGCGAPLQRAVAICSGCQEKGRRLCADISKNNHVVPHRSIVPWSQMVNLTGVENQNIDGVYCCFDHAVRTRCLRNRKLILRCLS